MGVFSSQVGLRLVAFLGGWTLFGGFFWLDGRASVFFGAVLDASLGRHLVRRVGRLRASDGRLDVGARANIRGSTFLNS